MQNCYIEDSAGNSLKIHDITDSACNFFLSQVAGLEFPAIRTASYPRAGVDGIDIPSQYTGERRVQLTGKMYNFTTAAAFTTIRQAFFKALKPSYDSTGVLVTKWLRFTAMDGNTYRLTGEVLDASAPIDLITSSSFVIDFLANSAVIEAYNASSLNLPLITLGGFILPVVLPIVFSQDTSTQVTATNNGDAQAWPILTLNGPLTTPRVTNITTGQAMALTLSIGAGQSVVIDMLNKTIVQGGITNQMQYKSSDSVFWPLQTGTQLIQLSSGNSADTGNGVLTWRNAFTGV